VVLSFLHQVLKGQTLGAVARYISNAPPPRVLRFARNVAEVLQPGEIATPGGSGAVKAEKANEASKSSGAATAARSSGTPSRTRRVQQEIHLQSSQSSDSEGILEIRVSGKAVVEARIVASLFGGPPPCEPRRLAFAPASDSTLCTASLARGTATAAGLLRAPNSGATAAAASGSILVAHRGGCSYATKALHALEAGAVGLVVLQAPTEPKTWLLRMPADPSLFADGSAALLKSLPAVMAPHALKEELLLLARRYRRDLQGRLLATLKVGKGCLRNDATFKPFNHSDPSAQALVDEFDAKKAAADAAQEIEALDSIVENQLFKPTGNASLGGGYDDDQDAPEAAWRAMEAALMEEATSAQRARIAQGLLAGQLSLSHLAKPSDSLPQQAALTRAEMAALEAARQVRLPPDRTPRVQRVLDVEFLAGHLGGVLPLESSYDVGGSATLASGSDSGDSSTAPPGQPLVAVRFRREQPEDRIRYRRLAAAAEGAASQEALNAWLRGEGSSPPITATSSGAAQTTTTIASTSVSSSDGVDPGATTISWADEVPGSVKFSRCGALEPLRIEPGAAVSFGWPPAPNPDPPPGSSVNDDTPPACTLADAIWSLQVYHGARLVVVHSAARLERALAAGFAPTNLNADTPEAQPESVLEPLLASTMVDDEEPTTSNDLSSTTDAAALLSIPVVRLAPRASQLFVRAMNQHGSGLRGPGDDDVDDDDEDEDEDEDDDGGIRESQGGTWVSRNSKQGGKVRSSALWLSLAASAHIERCWEELLHIARGGAKSWPMTRAARRKALLALLNAHGRAVGNVQVENSGAAAASGDENELESGQDLDRAELLAVSWRSANPTEPPIADAAASLPQSARTTQAAQRRRKRSSPQAFSNSEL